MSESSKKRKRVSDGERPIKSNPSTSSPRVKITHNRYEQPGGLLIGSGPGIALPTNIIFQAYQAIDESRPQKRKFKELLIQSSDHQVLNFTGQENQDGGVSDELKHYVAILDSAAGTLHIAETKQLSVRSTVRAEDDEALARRTQEREKGANTRRTLGLEFGTKKAKRAIAQNADNKIISPEKQRALSPGSLRKADPAASAVLDYLEPSALDAPTEEAIRAEVDEARPRPKHNAAAKRISDVYAIEELIGEDMMRALKVKPWVDAVEDEQDLEIGSRFVAMRVKSLADDDNIRQLKVAKYLLVLLNFLKACKVEGKLFRLPRKEDLRTKLGQEDSIISKLMERFTSNGKIRSWHVDLIKTTIAVLSLIVDDFETDTFDLRTDLEMKVPEINQYFAEIGARVKPPTDTERKQYRWTKTEAALHHFARLDIPLVFPKPRVVPRSRNAR